MADKWTFTKDGWEVDLEWPTEPGMLAMGMMTGQGDIRKIWNAANPDEVEDAKRSFDHLVKEKKYMAFKVDPDNNEKGDRIYSFDPKAGKVILVPPVAGG